MLCIEHATQGMVVVLAESRWQEAGMGAGKSDAPVNALAPRAAYIIRESVRATVKSHKRKVAFCLS